MIVTMDVYSGVPNPSWELSEADAKRLLERVEGKELTAAEDGPSVLGFRGFIVSRGPGDTEAAGVGLPESFRIDAHLASQILGDVGGEAMEEAAPGQPLTESDTDDALSFLLGTHAGAVDDELLQVARNTIEANKLAKEIDVTLPPRLPTVLCVIQNPPFNPGFWNTPAVQPRNNCYNYAMNYRSDTFAQPGRKVGAMYTALTCPNVGTAAGKDGCGTVCRGRTKYVALVIWPGRDFHWYAKHSHGHWGHKPGGTAARKTDNSGVVITNPQTCNRGPYTQFCGYRYSPVGMRVQ